MFSCWDADIVAKQWTGLMVAASAYGTVLTAVVYVKAHVAPSHPSDRKFSGKYQLMEVEMLRDSSICRFIVP